MLTGQNTHLQVCTDQNDLQIQNNSFLFFKEIEVLFYETFGPLLPIQVCEFWFVICNVFQTKVTRVGGVHLY